MSPKATPVAERFWALVQVGTADVCWLWLGKKSNGYGQFQVGSRTDGSRKTVYSHRLSYELGRGAIPAGLELDHLCRNRACVNPSHLEAVASRENTLRGNTITAANASKTHCKRGHLLSDENVFPYAKRLGVRACRACHALRYRVFGNGRRAEPSPTLL